MEIRAALAALALSLSIVAGSSPAQAAADANSQCTALLYRLKAAEYRIMARRLETTTREQRCAWAKREALPHVVKAWQTVLTSKACAHRVSSFTVQRATTTVDRSRASVERLCNAPNVQQASTHPRIRGRD
jgi:hypothetical protein